MFFLPLFLILFSTFYPMYGLDMFVFLWWISLLLFVDTWLEFITYFSVNSYLVISSIYSYTWLLLNCPPYYNYNTYISFWDMAFRRFFFAFYTNIVYHSDLTYIFLYLSRSNVLYTLSASHKVPTIYSRIRLLRLVSYKDRNPSILSWLKRQNKNILSRLGCLLV